MAFEAPVLASAFLLGLAGSVHCVGMCGGIAGALAQASGAEATPLASGLRSLLYSLGRVTSYAIAGALAGAFGDALSTGAGGHGWIRIAVGLVIIAIGLQLAIAGRAFAILERAGLRLWRMLAPIARRIGRPERIWQVFALGLLWGWLPCGLVYSALIVAAAAGSAAGGALAMASFGLGTLPALMAASGLGAALARFCRGPQARRVAGVVLVCFGLWSLVGPRALGVAHAPHHAGSAPAKAPGAPSPSGHPLHVH